jgi:DNA-directed RNA polymerase specialized sigma24 family protein
MTDHILTKKLLKEKAKTKRQLRTLLDEALLTAREREIVEMIYLQHKSLDVIADVLGYAESTVRLKHRQALQKIKYVMEEKDGQQ